MAKKFTVHPKMKRHSVVASTNNTNNIREAYTELRSQLDELEAETGFEFQVSPSVDEALEDYATSIINAEIQCPELGDYPPNYTEVFEVVTLEPGDDSFYFDVDEAIESITAILDDGSYIESAHNTDRPHEDVFITQCGDIVRDGESTRIVFDISNYLGGRNREHLEVICTPNEDDTYDVSIEDSWLYSGSRTVTTVYTLSPVTATRINTILRRVDTQLVKPKYNINELLRGMPVIQQKSM